MKITTESSQRPARRLHSALVTLALPLAAASGLLTACRDDAAAPVEVSMEGFVPPDTAEEPDSSLPMILLSPAFPKLEFTRPVGLTFIPDGSDRLVVIEQAGRALVFENRSDVTETEVFLDLRPKIFMTYGWGEEGLLSLAFHPQYAENGRAYVYYSAGDPRRTVLSEFTVAADDPDRLDPESERVLLEIEQPAWNHNGGQILFGPDGYLYLSIGDGGGANDQFGHGQDLSTLFATIIRINVDESGDERQYSIPPGNPFVDRPGARPEIWAYGLRNVWRMCFDDQTGHLWAGDVGQNAWEEIDLIERGGNYGWSLREGSRPFRPADAPDPPIDPIVEYSHRVGNSVTGGYVYRGQRNPDLYGAYVYGDYGSGRIWAFRYEDGEVVEHREILGRADWKYLTSFGLDQHGELYACTFDRLEAGAPGRVYRITQR